MITEEFVRVVKTQTSDAAVSGTIAQLKRPAGRSPKRQDVRLSEWYNQMKDEDQQMLRDVIKEAAELAVFEFFCVLDGVTAIENSSEKGDVELFYAKGANRILLNVPVAEELHNIFNRMCEHSLAAPMPRAELTPGDSGTS